MTMRLLPYGGYEFVDEFGNVQRINQGPTIEARNPSFKENMVDLLTPYIGQDTSESLFGGKIAGPRADALTRMVNREGLLGVMPISAGVMSGGQAVKDFQEGNIGSGIGNTAFAGLDLGLSGLGLRQAYKTARQSPELVELTQNPQNRKYFQGILADAQDSQGALGSQVSVYSPDEYKGMVMVASPYEDAGFAISPEGEIASLVKNKSSNLKGFAKKALNYAGPEGGVFLNAFDTELTKLYGKAGFKPVSRVKFDEKMFREEIGDKAVDDFIKANKKFNKGRPDLVFMVRDPDFKGEVKNAIGGRLGSYDQAYNDLLTEMERLGYINE